MRKIYLFILFTFFQFYIAQISRSGILENNSGKIITNSTERENLLLQRDKIAKLERTSMIKAAQNAVEMCSNGGFEQHESSNGNSYLKNFLYNIGNPPGPTQCQSISNTADAYIPLYNPNNTNLMATTVPANLIDPYMGNIKGFDQYSLKINYRGSSTYGSIVQGKRFKTNNENFLKFNYKAVLQSVYDTSHTDNQAFFKARILDKNGKVVNEFCLVGDEKNCIFTKVPDGSSGYVTLYTANWQSGILDISSIPNNEEFTVEFMASRCGLGGHFGYAYVDDICLLHSDESFMGTVTLDPLNAICPTMPLSVCGTYTLPNSGGITASIKKLTLNVFDESKKVVYTTSSASIDAINKKFCFNLASANLPNITQANYDVGVTAEYDIQGNPTCGGNNFFGPATDDDANDGWDISFLNCSTSCDINITTAKVSLCDANHDGSETFDLTTFNSKISTTTSGLTFSYFRTYTEAIANSNPISSSSQFTSPSATLYARVSKDASCFKIVPISLEVRNPTANISGVLNVCSGSTELTASDGASYLWNTGQTTKKITVTDVGDYSVTVTDTFGCTSTAKVTIEPSQVATLPTLEITQPSCFATSGTIKVTSPGSEYSFDDGKTWTTNPTKSGLSPGSYLVKMKTVKGCISYSQQVEIKAALLQYPYANTDQPKFCGDLGSITITTTAPYYSFDDGKTWGTDPTANNLKPGKYVIRTKDINGCISNQNVLLIISQTLGRPDFIVINPACKTLGEITINTPSDFYTFDGGTTWITSNKLTNLASGYYSVGVKNLQDCTSTFENIYLRNFEEEYPQLDVVQAQCGTKGTIYIKTEAAEYSFDGGKTWGTTNISDFSPGTYQIKVKNKNGCISRSSDITLYEPSLPTPIVSVIQPSCGSNGQVTINTVSDFYSFDNGATWTTSNTKSLPAGSYQIQVKNNIGCKGSIYVGLNIPRLPQADATVVQPTCTTKGSITINTTGDSYSIDGGYTWSTSPIFNNLASNSYDIRIKNSLGCVSEGKYVYLQSVYLPEPIYTAVSPSCGNTVGSITFTSTATSYSIDGGNSWSTSPVFSNLKEGYYYLIIKNGTCSSQSKQVELNKNFLAAPSFSIIQPDCQTKGSITINATADFYSIDGGYTWATTPTFSNLNDGYYNVKIKNKNNCESLAVYAVLNKFYLPNPNFNITPATCGVGATITISTPASEYSIDGGRTWSSNPVFTNVTTNVSYNIVVKNTQGCTSNPYNYSNSISPFYLPNPDVKIIQPICGQKGSIEVVTSASQYSFDGGNTWTTNPILSNLTDGYNNVVIKNAQGCISNPYGVSIGITKFYLRTPIIKTVQPTCANDGSITVVTDADYYSFDNGSTWTKNPTLLNPTPGYYNIKIKNALGCESQAAYTSIQKFYLNSPQITVIQPTCDQPQGSLIINTIADQYSFDNGKTWTTNPVKNNLASGYHNILIKNVYGCLSQMSSVYISNPPNIPAAPNVTATQPSSCDKTDGSITINTVAESYSFNNGLSWTTSPIMKNIGSGTYVIKVKTNSYSCESLTTTVNLDSGKTIAAPTVSLTQPTCSVETGTITVSTVGSTYSFDNGITYTYFNTKSNLIPGNYKVKIKNANGCISDATNVTITPQAPLPSPTFTISQPSCNNSLGEITITTATAAEYSFDNGHTFNSIKTKSNLGPGTYNLIIKDAAGCISLVSNATIDPQPTTPTAPQVSVNQPSGCAASTGKISIISPAASYSFDDGVTWEQNAARDLAPGNYSVRIKMATNGCPSPSTLVTINPPPNAPSQPVFIVTQPTSCANPFGSVLVTSNATEYSFDNGVTYSTNANSGNLAPGNYSIKVKNSAGCESQAMSFTINKPTDYPVKPTANLVQPNCTQNFGEITINKIASQYSIDNGATWQNSAKFTNLTPNSYFLKTKNNLGCTSEATSVIIIKYINTTPLPIVPAAQSFCIQNNATIANINVSGNNIQWYDALVGGNSIPNSTKLVNGQTYYVSQKPSGCESDRVSTKITIVATPAPSGNNNQIFCISQNATIADIKVNGKNIKWYDSTISTTPLLSTEKLKNGAIYYATQTDNNCEGIARFLVTVNIVSGGIQGLPTPEISSIQIENNSVTIFMKENTAYEFSLNGLNWQSQNTFNSLKPGNYKLYVRALNNICAITETSFTIFNIKNVISPNDDGVNDLWTIDGIENYPGSIVQVIDRFGTIVLDVKVNGTFSWNGHHLHRKPPTGNYWYHIKLSDGRILKGFLLIKNRN